MTPEQQRIADKILKLLALASSTTFAAEAATARRLAEELLALHKVDVSHTGKPSQDTFERRMYHPFAEGARWEGILVGAVCMLTNCTFFFWIDTLKQYELVGTIGNLDAAFYIINEINRQRRNAWMQHKQQAGADSFHKFAYGFAKALEDKIEQIVDLDKWYQHKQQVLKPWYERVTGYHVTSTSLDMGAASSDAGMDAGRGASLHRGSLSGNRQQRIASPPKRLIGPSP